MEEYKLPLMQHFSKLYKSSKWGFKLISVIIVLALSAIVGSFSIDFEKVYQGVSMSEQQLEQAKMFGKIGGAIGGTFVSIIKLVVTFIVFLIISKIMKSNVTKKTIFSATLSYSLITGFISLIVMFIQWIAGLSPTDYSITSLNIFDKGNSVLGSFDLQTFIGAYVFGIMLYATNHFSKKSTLVWAIAYIILLIAISLISAIL